MKKIKITDAKGKVHEIPGYWADAFYAAADAVENQDQIETAKLTAEIDGEAVELVLPKEMVVNMLAQVGVGGAGGGGGGEGGDGDGDSEHDIGDGDGDGDGDLEEEEDAAGQQQAAGLKMDAAVKKEVKKQLDAAVKKEVATHMGEHRRDAAERAEIERIAAPLVSDGYPFSESDPWKICADALTVDGKEDSAAVELAKKARKGDGRAQGELIAHLKFAAKAKKDAADSTGDLADAIAAGGARTDGETKLSTREQARKDQNSRFGKSRGQKPKTETKTDAA